MFGHCNRSLHAFAQGALSFSIFRAILGVAEAGNWPGAAKSNADWFPTKERALAQGIFNSGAAIGGIIAIPLIAYLTVFFQLANGVYCDWFSWFIVVNSMDYLSESATSSTSLDHSMKSVNIS